MTFKKRKLMRGSPINIRLRSLRQAHFGGAQHIAAHRNTSQHIATV